MEAGVHLGAIRESVFGESPVLAGGRFTARVHRFVGAEAEISRFPVGGAVALYPATQAFFGARIGGLFGSTGIFAKIRPGLTRFDNNAYVPDIGARPTLDAGAVFVFYSRRHFAARIDVGDTIVWYGQRFTVPQTATPGAPGVKPGARHQLQTSIGLSAWF